MANTKTDIAINSCRNMMSECDRRGIKPSLLANAINAVSRADLATASDISSTSKLLEICSERGIRETRVTGWLNAIQVAAQSGARIKAELGLMTPLVFSID